MAIEYSANLDSSVDMGELRALVSKTILETGLFSPVRCACAGK